MNNTINATVLPYIIELHLVDHCNLNCAGCSHFAPLVKDEVFSDFNTFKRDLLRLRQIFSDVYEIRLMGGEPLLHPDINGFIEFSRQAFPKANVSVSTNGMLLQNMPSVFWQTCAVNNVLVKLTNYPIRLDLSKIKRLGKSYRVRIKIPNQVNAFFQFINIKGDSNPTHSFRNCRAMYTTPFLRDGRLYSCSFAPHVHLFNEYFNQDIPVTDGDYINILEDVTHQQVHHFLENPIPLCKWCKTMRPYVNWSRSKGDINEWISGEANSFAHFFEIKRNAVISAYHKIKQTSEMVQRNKL
jgi:hypothetical protein